MWALSHLICGSGATGHAEFVTEEAASPGQVPGTEMHPCFTARASPVQTTQEGAGGSPSHPAPQDVRWLILSPGSVGSSVLLLMPLRLLPDPKISKQQHQAPLLELMLRQMPLQIIWLQPAGT